MTPPNPTAPSPRFSPTHWRAWMILALLLSFAHAVTQSCYGQTPAQTDAALRAERDANETALSVKADEVSQLQQQVGTLNISLANADASIANLNDQVRELTRLLAEAQKPNPTPVATIDLSGVPATWTAGDPLPVVKFASVPAGAYGIAGLTGPWVDIADAAKMVQQPAGERTLYAAIKTTDGRVLAESQRTITVTTPPVLDPPTTGKTTVTNFTPESGKTYRNLIIKGGFTCIWKSVHNVTFEDCDFVGGRIAFEVQGKNDGSITPTGWTLRRCTFTGARPTSVPHSHGSYLAFIGDFTFEDCTFDDNGWNKDGSRWNENHNVYLSTVGNIKFVRTKLLNPAAEGIKIKAAKSVMIDSCAFKGGLIGVSSDNRFVTGPVMIRNTTFDGLGGKDTNGNTKAWAIDINNVDTHSFGPVVINGCKFGAPVVLQQATAVNFKGSKILPSLLVNCDFAAWKAFGGKTLINGIGARLTITGNAGL